MRVGLRVDVDTLRGTRLGVPGLCRMLERRGALATFFFSVGPDNMGRHLWRLARPSFLWKMLRSNAPGLYGWDILLRGTLWPGPEIGAREADTIRRTAAGGHEVGLHAWDHHAWQSRIGSWSSARIRQELARGAAGLAAILGAPPTCSAAPAWRFSDAALEVTHRMGLRFSSDCRGASIFAPVKAPSGEPCGPPQIPVTLPTFDELVGRNGVTPRRFFEDLLQMLRPKALNVLTVHAEVEGISQLDELEAFIVRAQAEGWSFVPLGMLLDDSRAHPRCAIDRGTVPGRSGWVSVQRSVQSEP